MSNIVHKNSDFSSRDNNHNIKEKLDLVIKNFQVKAELLHGLLGISSDKINKILQNESCALTNEELAIIGYRLPFLCEGFSIIDPRERIKLIIDSVLIDEYHLSYESLVSYAGPYDVFNKFYNDEKIESNYLITICVNLLMLFFVLKNMAI